MAADLLLILGSVRKTPVLLLSEHEAYQHVKDSGIEAGGGTVLFLQAEKIKRVGKHHHRLTLSLPLGHWVRVWHLDMTGGCHVDLHRPSRHNRQKRHEEDGNTNTGEASYHVLNFNERWDNRCHHLQTSPSYTELKFKDHKISLLKAKI